jgi:hypothetical protein
MIREEEKSQLVDGLMNVGRNWLASRCSQIQLQPKE